MSAAAPERRLRIAYFSPLPPQRSGIADYSAELLPHLARLADVTVFAAEPQGVSTAVREQFDVRDQTAFAAARAAFDLPLYHIGNSPFHDAILPLTLRYPGVLVLHDFFLHHAAAQRTLGAGDAAAYLREMAYAGGAAGARRALAVAQGLIPAPVFSAPLNERLLDSSLGVIVHSEFVAQQVRASGYTRRLDVVPALIEDVAAPSRRAALGLAQDAVLLASFGLITAEKQVTAVLQALRELRRTHPQVHYLLVGERMPGLPLEALIAEYGLGGAVHLAGFAPDLQTFAGWMAAADVVINLRFPTVGETSATALRALVAGRPLLVYDTGWYAELPPAVALRVPPLDQAALLRALRELVDSADLRQEMGRAARAYARAAHAPPVVARAYVAALQATLDGIAPPLRHG